MIAPFGAESQVSFGEIIVESAGDSASADNDGSPPQLRVDPLLQDHNQRTLCGEIHLQFC